MMVEEATRQLSPTGLMDSPDTTSFYTSAQFKAMWWGRGARNISICFPHPDTKEREGARLNKVYFAVDGSFGINLHPIQVSPAMRRS